VEALCFTFRSASHRYWRGSRPCKLGPWQQNWRRIEESSLPHPQTRCNWPSSSHQVSASTANPRSTLEQKHPYLDCASNERRSWGHSRIRHRHRGNSDAAIGGVVVVADDEDEIATAHEELSVILLLYEPEIGSIDFDLVRALKQIVIFLLILVHINERCCLYPYPHQLPTSIGLQGMMPQLLVHKPPSALRVNP
jgi:hypothetical protein